MTLYATTNDLDATETRDALAAAAMLAPPYTGYMRTHLAAHFHLSAVHSNRRTARVLADLRATAAESRAVLAAVLAPRVDG